MSLPGLTRQSIYNVEMDARIKSGHDEEKIGCNAQSSRYVKIMLLRLAAALFAGLMFGAGAARAAENNTLYNIMVPEKGVRTQKQAEPWLAPRYETPRSQRQPVIVVPENPRARTQATVPPPILSPRTGRALPNLPGASSSEGFQDRAARCAHQAGAYGNDINSPAGYIGACINQ
jgi:hypothetical protein